MQNDDSDVEAKQARQERRQKNYESLMISPARQDAFDEATTENPFAEAMRAAQYEKERREVAGRVCGGGGGPPQKKSRWDKGEGAVASAVGTQGTPGRPGTAWEQTPGSRAVWEETPGCRSSRGDCETPVTMSGGSRGLQETPRVVRGDCGTPATLRGDCGTPGYSEASVREDLAAGAGGDTPQRTVRRSRWDDTPQHNSNTGTGSSRGDSKMRSHATPSHYVAFTPSSVTSNSGGMGSIGGATPAGNRASFLLTPSQTPQTPEQLLANRFRNDMEERNRYLTDLELDELLPPGFKILRPPKGYTGASGKSKITGTPTPAPLGAMGGVGFSMAPASVGVAGRQAENELAQTGAVEVAGGQLLLSKEDYRHFELLLEPRGDDRTLTAKERKQREVLGLLLRYKNGVPADRRSARRELVKRCEEFGPTMLFEPVLPILLDSGLEDQERYLLVKLLNLFLYKLEDKVRPFTHKVLVVVIPMLIDEERVTRQVGKEVLSNLAKAVGLSTMITVLRPDLDNLDEGVRKVCATALAIVGHSLGLPSLLPFLKAVCKSKKSWQARHTGIRIVHQLAIMLKCSILPHLSQLVNMIETGLEDEQQQVRSITALTVAALAESSAPYGLDSFDSVLKPLWKGIQQYRGKNLAAYLKAIGYIVSLMDGQPDYARYYIKETMVAVIREFQTPDETMKEVVLTVLVQCCRCGHIDSEYIAKEIVPPFFRHFWNGRNANCHKLQELMVTVTVEMCSKLDMVMTVLPLLIGGLKDESEQFRRLGVESIDKILAVHHDQLSTLIDLRTEKLLIDSLMMCVFNDQSNSTINNSSMSNNERCAIINSYGSIMMRLGVRCRPYLPEVCAQAVFRMNNKAARTRQQAADIIATVAPLVKLCGEERRLVELGQFMFENLGEEYPDVLGSVLKALDSVVRQVGVELISPPIGELLPRLTPILKNRQEKVQEGCLELVGHIAERAGDQVNSREWIRIAFDLVAIFSSPRKAIRRAAINTFGYIASAVGPLDVLAVLLNNLKVQDRQNRVCSTIAIAVVAEVCRPFNALAAVMNEYRTPDMNVQNGVLKSLSFMFEYIGDVSKDYIYAVTGLLAEAVTERDIVHRQTAISAIGHIALGVYGYGCEDALVHLLNCVWPNCLETSPHMEQVFIRCMEAFGVSLGANTVLPYLTQGLYHPAHAVRRVSWKIYNAIYMQNQDGLVASYPQVEDQPPRHVYTRYELHYRL